LRSGSDSFTLAAILRSIVYRRPFMDDVDSDEYHAVCEIEKPFAWRNPLVFKHLVSMAKSGRIVVAKSGLRAWRIFGDGRWGVQGLRPVSIRCFLEPCLHNNSVLL